MSKATVEKAQRLTREGRIAPVIDARVWRVVGDNGIYIVAMAGVEITCNCPASGACSHITACLLAIREEAADTAGEEHRR